MMHETITLDCEAFGFIDLDVMYEEITEDNSFDHKLGTGKRVDEYSAIYQVQLRVKLRAFGKECVQSVRLSV